MEENVIQYRAFMHGEMGIPTHLAPRKTEKGILFKYTFLEKYISRTPIWVAQSLWIIISGVALWHSIVQLKLPLYSVLLLFISGMLFWTLAEYGVHRFLYHTETNSKFLLRIQHNAHGIHHQYPRDPDRLAMPPVPAILIASLFFGLFWIVLHQSAFPFFAGFVLGYVFYISFHYAEHRIRNPRYFKNLWTHHAFHHYRDPYKDFGVSTQLWDWIFGTLSNEKARKTNLQ